MKILRVLLSFLLGVFLVGLPVLAQEFPQPVGYVNDFAGMFSFSFRQSLEQELVAFEEETTAEIAVVTIDSLEGGSLEDYAVRLFEEWQIGKKDKDNGLLLLIAEEERKIKIEVGYGLEPVITDGRAGRIIREQMQPSFREENYEEGVRLAVSQIEEYIRVGEPVAETQGKVTTIFPFLVIIFFMFVYFASFLGRTKEFWTGGIMGAIFGAFLGIIVGSLWSLFGLALGLGLLGLFLDFILSKNYKKLRKAGKATGFWSSRGGFSSGGGGFGGFGGGRSGGGGASGGW